MSQILHEMDEIVAILHKLINLPQVSKQALEELFVARFQRITQHNPYWDFFEMRLPQGPFTKVQYREPGRKATSQACGLILTVHPELQVTETEVNRWYGPGRIEQIIPEAQPTGLINKSYQIKGQEVIMAYTGQTDRLRTMILWLEGQNNKS